jgi:hypothetical protein
MFNQINQRCRLIDNALIRRYSYRASSIIFVIFSRVLSSFMLMFIAWLELYLLS